MGPLKPPQILGMDIIMCMTCGEKWTHGTWPDHGGQAAHEHIQSKPKHRVVVGDAHALIKLFKESK